MKNNSLCNKSFFICFLLLCSMASFSNIIISPYSGSEVPLFTAPDAPTNLVATAGVNSAMISFTAPTNDGGANITSYQYTINDGSSWTAIESTTSPLFIGGLTSCTDYTVKIRAVNIAGGGTASAAVTVTPQNGQQAGVKWTSRTSASDNSWFSVTYGNGIFVAVAGFGTSNRVMTSSDGITWTTRTASADYAWRSVTYGNGLFVALSTNGSGNQVMTSSDGITWTSRITPVLCSWSSVTYGNGLFVAVAINGGNRVMTSPDGITWTAGTASAAFTWQSITYGNGLFVAVSSTGTGNRVMTSPDGITWTSRTSAEDNNWLGIAYGNRLFVAVAGSGTGNRVMTSPDGINWTIRNSASDYTWRSVTYGNGIFVAISTDGIGNGVMTSPDGITWTSKTSAADNSWFSVAYGNGIFVAVASSGTGNRVMTSSDAFAPGIPTINSATPGVTSASVDFTAPTSSGYSAITNYEYSIDNGSNWQTPSPAITTNPLEINGLSTGMTYQLQLRTVNSVGSGCASSTSSFKTLNVVLPIGEISLSVLVQQNGVKLQWTNPFDNEMSKYEVERSADGRVFAKLNTLAAGNGVYKNITYDWFDAVPLEGHNYYRIKGLALNFVKTQWSNVVRVRSKTLNHGTTIVPNPASKTGFNVKTDLPKGYYIMKLLDTKGKVVYNKGLEYTGLGGAIQLRFGFHLAAGTYYLHIKGMGETVVRTAIIE
jgi:hypothetical protein